MSFKHMDIEAGMRRLADRRIEEAMREGKFDNLPGAGKPLDLEPMPANENARLTWWALRILKQHDFTPEEIRWRKQIDDLKDELARATTERRVIALSAQINRLVQQLNTLGTNALNSPVTAVSLPAELQKLRDRMTAAATPAPAATAPEAPAPAPFAKVHQAAPAASIRHCSNANCESRNPASARFCRRCGSMIRPQGGEE